MACTYQQHLQAVKNIMGPAYLGAGLPNAFGQTYFQNFNTGFPTFSAHMWSQYITVGCSWWLNRIAHWTNQLNNNTYNPYQTQLKQAKIAFATHMHGICGCTTPIPLTTPNTTYEIVVSEEELEKSNALIDDFTIEYEKYDK
jgi:hypothetical protein